MPRTVWPGAISFGLVTVPIHMVDAREDHSIHFLQVRLEDMGRVRSRKICEIEGREVAQSEIGKGYRSVAKARKSRGDDATVHDLPKKKTTAKKAAAKKTAARKTRRSA
ncbi:Ku protein [Streptomyces sp. NBC_00659]|uniref:Ku protein n=1 Tax=Streptomyces sp. NBC_00659 TaxID=2903669 RepID=UPI003FCDA9BE